MKNVPLVSVVVYTFNHEAFIAQALNSILESKLEQVEVIICDDSSTDNSHAVIEEWGRRFKSLLHRFIVVRHDHFRGRTAALNEMVAGCQGMLIHFLDGNNYFLPEGLTARTEAMLANPNWKAAFSDGRAVDFNGEIFQESLLETSSVQTARLGPHDMAEELFYNGRGLGHALSWQRSAFKTHGGEFDYGDVPNCESYGTFWWALSRRALGYIPSPCYAARLDDDRPSNGLDSHCDLQGMARVLAKNAAAFPLRLAESMRNLALAYFYAAAGDIQFADPYMRRFQEEKLQYNKPAEVLEAEPLTPANDTGDQQDIFTTYAQNYEDVILWRALKNVRNGTYVDVGAQDPVIDSVTKAFYDRGWRGLNVEAQTEYYNKLSLARPHDINVHAFAGGKTGFVEFHSISGTGLSTSNAELVATHKAAGFEVVSKIVSVKTLDAILAEAGLNCREIHFLKIDVEGAEAEVLRGLELKLCRPWIIIIEATHPLTRQTTHAAFESIVCAAGYQFSYFDGLNRYYLSEEKAHLHAVIALPPNIFDVFVKHDHIQAKMESLEMQGRMALLLAEHDKLVEEVKHYKGEHENIATAMRVLAAERDEFAEGAKYYKEEHENIAAALTALTVEQNNFAVRVESLTVERDKLGAEVKHYSGEHNRLDTRVEALSAENNNLSAGLRFLTAERNDLSTARMALAEERDHLAADLRSLTMEHDNLVKERSALMAERDRLTPVLASLSAERDHLAADLRTLAAERDALAARANSLTAEREESMAQHDTLSAKLKSVSKLLSVETRQRKQVVSCLENTHKKLLKVGKEQKVAVKKLYGSKRWKIAQLIASPFSGRKNKSYSYLDMAIDKIYNISSFLESFRLNRKNKVMLLTHSQEVKSNEED